MKYALVIPIVCSLLLGYFMLYGFMQLVNDILLQMDYYLFWSLTLVEVLLVAGTPWLTWLLLGTNDKRTLKNQLGLNLGFLLSSVVFFAFGFLLISMDPDQNPLLPSFVKYQPFTLYWSIWFALGDVLVVAFFLLNKRQVDNSTIDN